MGQTDAQRGTDKTRVILEEGKSYGVGDGTVGWDIVKFLYRLSHVTVPLSVTV